MLYCSVMTARPIFYYDCTYLCNFYKLLKYVKVTEEVMRYYGL